MAATVIDFPSFLIGAAAGAMLLAALVLPRVGRILVRMAGTVSLACGAGLITWSTVALSTGRELSSIEWGAVRISSAPEAYAWGAVTLVVGGLALGLSFLRNGHVLPPGQRL